MLGVEEAPRKHVPHARRDDVACAAHAMVPFTNHQVSCFSFFFFISLEAVSLIEVSWAWFTSIFAIYSLSSLLIHNGDCIITLAPLLAWPPRYIDPAHASPLSHFRANAAPIPKPSERRNETGHVSRWTCCREKKTHLRVRRKFHSSNPATRVLRDPTPTQTLREKALIQKKKEVHTQWSPNVVKKRNLQRVKKKWRRSDFVKSVNLQQQCAVAQVAEKADGLWRGQCHWQLVPRSSWPSSSLLLSLHWVSLKSLPQTRNSTFS